MNTMNEAVSTEKIVRASIPSDAYAFAKAGAAMNGQSIPDWLADAVKFYFAKQATAKLVEAGAIQEREMVELKG